MKNYLDLKRRHMKDKDKIDGQKVIVALDGLTPAGALKIALELKGKVWGFKINDLLYESDMIHKLKKFGHIFADAKLYDIPNTVAHSVAKLSAAGADFITIHASGGAEMMRAAKRSAGNSRIIAVTRLTSFGGNAEKEVLKLTRGAIEANADGIVCSGRELTSLACIRDFLSLIKIVPGIRPKWYKKSDDQVRTITPQKALNFGANYLVIGRPITKSKNPVKALKDL